jgi:solute carrier family 25 carnitine/acylcarnitine transporter 20/29
MINNDFIYGLCGGLVGTIISHPFDTVKTRIQSNTSNTIYEAIKRGKLYSGITPPLIGIMLEKSIVFGFYEKSKKYGMNDFISGLIGGFTSTLIVTPVDRLKINFQNNFKDGIKINTLYKGFMPTIFRETPGFGIYFSVYNYLNNFNQNKNIYKTFLFGGLSGFSAWIFIYPSDLIKTKYQSSNNKNLFDIIKITYNSFGIKGFYKGFNLAILRAIPLHGGVFVGYEISKKYF